MSPSPWWWPRSASSWAPSSSSDRPHSCPRSPEADGTFAARYGAPSPLSIECEPPIRTAPTFELLATQPTQHRIVEPDLEPPRIAFASPGGALEDRVSARGDRERLSQDLEMVIRSVGPG